MNKFTKASIATGAGIVLLLGGAGTFAYWNDDATLTAGTITSGTLKIEAGATGTWTDTSNNSTISNIANFRVVPGDELLFAQDVKVNATGDNLVATLSVDSSTVASGALADELEYEVSATAAGTTVVDNGDGTFEITPGTAGVTDLAVQVRVVFPDTVSGVTAQGVSANLAGLKLVLQQH
jgi:alternate signal-mediated exported protein